MPDQEFYRSPEHWPQPAEEACTLENTPEATIPREPKKKKKSARQRKKLSESLAGVTVAALTVVMVATAIPDMKDAFGGIQDDFQGILGGSGEICPVCGQEDCAFYMDGMPGLQVSLYSQVEYQPMDDLYSMTGFTQDDEQYMVFTGSVTTETGQRLVLRVKDSLMDVYSGNVTTDGWADNADLDDLECPALTGGMIHGDNPDSPEEHFLWFSLAYTPEQGMSMEGIPTALKEQYRQYDFEDASSNFAVLDEIPKTYLRMVVSPRSLEVNQKDYMEAVPVEKPGLRFDLGQTMVFTETEKIYRNYFDGVTGGRTRNHNFQQENGDVKCFLDHNFLTKEYGIRSTVPLVDPEIYIAGNSWRDIFATWQERNQEAERTGHPVCYPMMQKNNITVNGIEYYTYIVYTAAPVDSYNHYPWIWYYFVPVQEDNIAFVDCNSIDPEALQATLNQDINERHYFVRDFLPLITLK